MYDVTALGEILIDFTPLGLSGDGLRQFEQNPGGAPANVLSILAKLGKHTAFIGKVGQDEFGTYLGSTLKKFGISDAGLVQCGSVNTTLAFVHLNESGDRSFTFYRNPGADMLLEWGEVNLKLIEECRIFHCGSVSMTDEPSCSATVNAMKHAGTCGKLVSFDVNLRPRLWKNLEDAKKRINAVMSMVDLLKVSEEEAEFLTGCNELDKSTGMICEKYGIPAVFVTMGSKGVFYRCGSYTGRANAFDVKTVDTTGAGDAFTGAVLYKVLERGSSLSGITPEEMQELAVFGCAAGSLSTRYRGAMASMPDLKDIEDIISKWRYSKNTLT